MKPKVKPILSIAVLAAAALSLAACNHTHAPTDSEITGQVQGKFYADQAVGNKGIEVTASNGVVTLTGAASSDAERNAAASDAASVAGVRTVVNDLTVTPPQPAEQTAAVEQPAPAAPSEPAAEPAPEPTTPERRVRHRHERQPKPSAARWREARHQEASQSYRDPGQSYASNQNYPPPPPSDQPYQSDQSYPQAQPVQQQPAPPAHAPPPPAAVPPPPPAQPALVTIPYGTTLAIRLLDPLDSASAQPGDTFRASLSEPVWMNGNIVIPRDADLRGRVVDVHEAGRFKGAALLSIELTQISFNGHSYPIRTDQWSREIQGRGRNTAEKVGGGAALGAIIGALAGGGKGAAIGTIVGGGAGGTAQAVTHAKQVTLEPETLLSFRLEQSLTVHPSSVIQRNAGRPRLE